MSSSYGWGFDSPFVDHDPSNCSIRSMVENPNSLWKSRSEAKEHFIVKFSLCKALKEVKSISIIEIDGDFEEISAYSVWSMVLSPSKFRRTFPSLIIFLTSLLNSDMSILPYECI
jgi:hypothetical protein